MESNSPRGKFGFFRKLINKKLNKLQYRGTNYPYLISFEKTKLDWYTSSAAQISVGGNNKIDMVFFPDSEDSNNFAAVYVNNLDEPMFTDEVFGTIKSWAKDDELKIESAAQILLNKTIERFKNAHQFIRGKDWEMDGEPFILEPANKLAIEIRGVIKSKSMRTIDFLYPMNDDPTNPLKNVKRTLMLGAVTSWNQNKWVAEDLENIAKSINF